VSTQSFEETFARLYSEAYQLLCDKQERYGDVNIQQLGLHGVVSRIAHDKVSRAKKFLNGKVRDGQVILDPLDENADESITDTLLDIANYALIAVALHRGKWGRSMDGGDRALVRKNAQESEEIAVNKKSKTLPKNLANLRVDILGAKK
jgi:hypothetical protein